MDGWVYLAAIDSTYRYASRVPEFVVSSSDPAAAATNVPINKTINVTFSIALDKTTLNNTNITLTPGPVATTISLATNGTTVVVDPNSNLANNTLYTVTLKTGLRGLFGPWKVPWPEQSTFSFTTVP
jgi:hypothetical protein